MYFEFAEIRVGNTQIGNFMKNLRLEAEMDLEFEASEIEPALNVSYDQLLPELEKALIAKHR